MDEKLAELEGRLAQSRAELLAALEGLSPEELDQRPSDGGRSLRQILHLLADHESDHIFHLLRARRGAGSRVSEVHRLLAELAEVRGRLLANLAGLRQEHLDLEWEDGEWTVRQILEHLGETERHWVGEIGKARQP